MIAFEVSLNGEPVCTAGIEGFGVLTAIMQWVRLRPEISHNGKTIGEELALEVAGLTGSEHLKWLSKKLQVGDSLTVKISSREQVDSPAERHRDDPDIVAQAKRRYYEKLKSEYGD